MSEKVAEPKASSTKEEASTFQDISVTFLPCPHDERTLEALTRDFKIEYEDTKRAQSLARDTMLKVKLPDNIGILIEKKLNGDMRMLASLIQLPSGKEIARVRWDRYARACEIEVERSEDDEDYDEYRMLDMGRVTNNNGMLVVIPAEKELIEYIEKATNYYLASSYKDKTEEELNTIHAELITFGKKHAKEAKHSQYVKVFKAGERLLDEDLPSYWSMQWMDAFSTKRNAFLWVPDKVWLVGK